jgi:hypothetical protein
LVRDGNVKSYDPPPAISDAAFVAALERIREPNLEPEGLKLGREPAIPAPNRHSGAPTEPSIDGWALPAVERTQLRWSQDQVDPHMPLLSRSARVAYTIVLVAMVASAVALLISHRGGDGGRPPTAKSIGTTVPKGAPGTTTKAVTTTLPPPPALQSSASAAAANLISSWAAGNQAEALSVATAPAVATLFAAHYSNGLAIDRGCSAAFSPIVCTYGPPGGAAPTDPIYELYVTQVPGGWYVSSSRVEN